ncbi:MAG: HEAT repeat domain-containing protein [Phycisphaerae bacterium]
MLVLLAPGCISTPRIDPAQRERLERRSLDLLLRAAQSQTDVVACNAMEALVDVAPRDGAPVFRANAQSPSGLIRFAALVALGEVRDGESLGTMRRAMEDSDNRIKLAGAFGAVRCGDEQHAGRLFTALDNSPDENLRADAAFLLGRLKEPRAEKRLRLRMRDKSNKVAVQVCTALALLNDRQAIDQLVQFAQGEAVSRVLALQGLVEVASPRTQDALRLRLADPREYLEHRLIAARALGRIGNRDGFRVAADSIGYSSSDGEDVDRTMRVRSLAALALGAIRDPRGLPYLEQLASDQGDMRTQVAACYAILQILGATPR